ncbi:hypothetical protein HYH03_016947 [Edaphochlamys debaryana]|uniref:Non-structural maintenance of chromosomes element 4 n=1 Tax=Edaphochlamys debaryana TaxID=47281 RepID=A0A836BPR3_9CHLO|nr:hypothetical protein HYH03_016947 [Edaphochlamys debaryana]|eukprot:KAG2484212.1 hypothetical protein HYH03_016947 [Edaphochlamys debaryana]
MSGPIDLTQDDEQPNAKRQRTRGPAEAPQIKPDPEQIDLTGEYPGLHPAPQHDDDGEVIVIDSSDSDEEGPAGALGDGPAHHAQPSPDQADPANQDLGGPSGSTPKRAAPRAKPAKPLVPNGYDAGPGPSAVRTPAAQRQRAPAAALPAAAAPEAPPPRRLQPPAVQEQAALGVAVETEDRGPEQAGPRGSEPPEGPPARMPGSRRQPGPGPAQAEPGRVPGAGQTQQVAPPGPGDMGAGEAPGKGQKRVRLSNGTEEPPAAARTPPTAPRPAAGARAGQGKGAGAAAAAGAAVGGAAANRNMGSGAGPGPSPGPAPNAAAGPSQPPARNTAGAGPSQPPRPSAPAPAPGSAVTPAPAARRRAQPPHSRTATWQRLSEQGAALEAQMDRLTAPTREAGLAFADLVHRHNATLRDIHDPGMTARDATQHAAISQVTLQSSVAVLRLDRRGPAELVDMLKELFPAKAGEGGGAPDGVGLDWRGLGEAVAHLFRPARGPSVMLGAVDAQPKVRRAPVRRAQEQVAAVTRPQELAAGEGLDTQKADSYTSAIMSEMLKALRNLRGAGEAAAGAAAAVAEPAVRLPNGLVVPGCAWKPLVEVVLDRAGFAQTVENLHALGHLCTQDVLAVRFCEARGMLVAGLTLDDIEHCRKLRSRGTAPAARVEGGGAATAAGGAEGEGAAGAGRSGSAAAAGGHGRGAPPPINAASLLLPEHFVIPLEMADWERMCERVAPGKELMHSRPYTPEGEEAGLAEGEGAAAGPSGAGGVGARAAGVAGAGQGAGPSGAGGSGAGPLGARRRQDA